MNIRTVYVEITNYCNLNCATCYNRSGLPKKKENITVAQIEEIINTFTRYGLQRILISGGEPCLHPDFNDMLGLADRYPMLSFGVVTNGSIHSDKLISAVNSGKVTLQVSLDGSCENVNSRTRGIGNFHKTSEFLNVLDNKETLLKMVVSKNNIGDVADFYHLAVSKNCTPEFGFVTRRGNANTGWDSLALSGKEKLETIKTIESLNAEHQLEAFLPLCAGQCPYSDKMQDLTLCIVTNGTIQPCSLLSGNEHSLGNVFSFDENTFCERMSQIAALAKERLSSDFNCLRCMLRDSCNKGCIGAAYANCGDVFGDDGDCKFRQLQFFGYYMKKAGI